MAQDKLAELREEWYSEADTQPESVEDVIDNELLELQILFKSRGVTVSGDASVTVSDTDEGEPQEE